MCWRDFDKQQDGERGTDSKRPTVSVLLITKEPDVKCNSLDN